MSGERPDASPRKAEVLQISTQLSEDFLDERPGWTENYLRKVAAKWLEAAQADAAMAFEASTITSELAANTVKYGRSASHLAVGYTPPEAGPESIDIVAVNPARGQTATPGTEHRGGLASSERNDTSEHGRGLMMTNAYTQGNWGQRNVVSPDGKHEIITFAILSSQPSGSDALYEDAA